MKSTFIAVIIILLSACAAKSVLFSQADVDRGAAKFPGTTSASLTTGKTNYETNCQSCHGLVAPASQSEEKWRKIVPLMVRKTNKKAGKIAVDSTMEESILRYVVTMCTAPSPNKPTK